ncbi:MAG: peptide chain release factor N(5)-glutamine methyltransferase [Candidatus Binatia bacterium]|nr:peptide chain release factor N(5)-glutamine methyltransferase [Candidatus Binatia bacterium]
MNATTSQASERVEQRVTLRQWVARATCSLHTAGVRDARVAAEWLALEALGVDRAALYVRLDDCLPPTVAARLEAWLRRCAAREPVAYVVGRREFWSREFLVTPAVLVPRPESELLIEEALRRFPRARQGTPVCAGDIGTGSGCLAVTLACEWPGATVIASDISGPALAVARANAERHGVASRVHLLAACSLQAFAAESFDLLVANPPYLSTAELEGAEPELRFEPRAALDGGRDGLAVIRDLIADAGRVLRPGGWLLMEIGGTQREAVVNLLRQAGAREWWIRHDLAGWPRLAAGRW